MMQLLQFFMRMYCDMFAGVYAGVDGTYASQRSHRLMPFSF